MLFFIINFYFWEDQFELNNMGSFGNFKKKMDTKESYSNYIYR